jgi:hypothetical protein
MKNYAFIALVFSALLIVSCGKQQPGSTTPQLGLTGEEAKKINALSDSEPTKPYGVWLASDDKTTIENKNYAMRVEVTIQKDSITVTKKCSYENTSVIAQATAKCEITDTELTVLEDVSKVETLPTHYKEPINCDATLAKSKAIYKRNGDTLDLTDPNSNKTYTVQRVK